VIRSFGNNATEGLWSRHRSKELDPRIERVALRKLAMLDAAETLNDLRVPPGNRLEALRGDRVGQHSIRINQQWRICSTWTDAGPQDVQIVDYHQEVVTMAEIEPVHPGEVLMEEFLEPLGVTQHRLAVEIGVPPRRINEIVHRKRRITADTALRLARYFGTTDRFWLNLQTRYDLEIEKDHLGAALEAIRPLQSA
jgi:addiction module HigA family antidote